ncbi:MAG: NADH-quinone oxidoreductase subunit L [Bacteroidia bacterium]|nr:NADH-quinone oxidoreductase subunit L [Bacteroidia bacterium]
MGDFSYILWILVLPMATFLITALGGKRIPASVSGALGTVSMLVAAAHAWLAASHYFTHFQTADAYPSLKVLEIPWLTFNESLRIDLGIILDPISAMMLVVVTTISLMVHVYSLGYMKGEERFTVYYSFLSLFSFSMLGLVVSSNLFQMYIFWELVGLSSFLLIGYYYDKPSAVAASKKAFIVTRFADLGFLAGILILSWYSGSLDFGEIISRMTDMNSPCLASATGAGFIGASMLTWALVLIFIGGAGKSAMFPLHIWLPDAMEGPTPVSALIHAATMVVAGVYLVARLFPVYSMVPVALDIVAWTGAISAVIAAVIACTQTDIKRVLAYSTMSQIGYMMFALGVSGYASEGLGFTASMFHLFTHAMFKALLFLGAGAVIHYVHSNEMKDMGGLRREMPLTHLVFLIACLAIAGIPPLSGFFSKEEILTAAHASNPAIYYIALFTAGLTAFYMFRLYFNIFWNKPRLPHTAAGNHHGEAPWSMKLPLILLALATIAAGFIPFHSLVTTNGKHLMSEFHMSGAIAAVGVGLSGILLSAFFYLRKRETADRVSALLGDFYTSAYRKFYVDELYLIFTKRIVFTLISRPANWIDRNIVNGLINLTADLTMVFSDQVKEMQSGKIHGYVLWFFAGTIVLLCMLILI